MAQEDGAQESSHSQESQNSKDAFFDSKPKPKIIRVLTVLAYILSVSMAAIILSVYYIFVWHGEPHLGARRNFIPNYNYSVQERFTGLKNLRDLENQTRLILHNYYDDIGNASETERKLPKNGSEENEDMQRQWVNLEIEDKLLGPTEKSSEENATNWQEDYPDGSEDLSKTSVFIKKLFYKNDRNM